VVKLLLVKVRRDCLIFDEASQIAPVWLGCAIAILVLEEKLIFLADFNLGHSSPANIPEISSFVLGSRDWQSSWQQTKVGRKT
jgi:hypothetical protein